MADLGLLAWDRASPTLSRRSVSARTSPLLVTAVSCYICRFCPPQGATKSSTLSKLGERRRVFVHLRQGYDRTLNFDSCLWQTKLASVPNFLTRFDPSVVVLLPKQIIPYWLLLGKKRPGKPLEIGRFEPKCPPLSCIDIIVKVCYIESYKRSEGLNAKGVARPH